MKKAVILLAVMLALAGGKWAQHHPAPTIISGAEHPERISDTTAYDQILFHLAKAQRVWIIGMSKDDEGKANAVLSGFLAKHKAWIDRWNAEAETLGEKFDPTPFLIQQDALIGETRAAFKGALSLGGMTTLDEHVRRERQAISITDSVTQIVRNHPQSKLTPVSFGHPAPQNFCYIQWHYTFYHNESGAPSTQALLTATAYSNSSGYATMDSCPPSTHTAVSYAQFRNQSTGATVGGWATTRVVVLSALFKQATAACFIPS